MIRRIGEHSVEPAPVGVAAEHSGPGRQVEHPIVLLALDCIMLLLVMAVQRVDAVGLRSSFSSNIFASTRRSLAPFETAASLRRTQLDRVLDEGRCLERSCTACGAAAHMAALNHLARRDLTYGRLIRPLVSAAGYLMVTTGPSEQMKRSQGHVSS